MNMAMPSIFNSSILLSSKTSFPATSRCSKATPTQPILRGTHRSFVARAFGHNMNPYQVLEFLGVKEYSALVHCDRSVSHGVYQKFSLDLEKAMIFHFSQAAPKLLEGTEFFFDGRDLGYLEEGQEMKFFTMPDDVNDFKLKIRQNWDFSVVIPRVSSELEGTLVAGGEQWSIVELKDKVIITIWMSGISKRKLILLDQMKSNIVGLFGAGDWDDMVAQFVLNPKFNYKKMLDVEHSLSDNVLKLYVAKEF